MKNYFIGFEAKGLTTIVDSVKVENLTQLTKLSLSGVDVLHLTGAVGMNNLSQNEGTVVVNPNPMQGQAELLFYTKQANFLNAIVIKYYCKNLLFRLWLMLRSVWHAPTRIAGLARRMPPGRYASAMSL